MKNFRDYIIIIITSVLLVLTFVWAKTTRLDVVTKGEGRVVATGDNQVIQSPIYAKISEFHKLENEIVLVGDTLITLSPTQAAASLAELEIKIKNLQARKVRLNGELSNRSVDEIKKTLSVYSEEIAASEIKNVIARRQSLDARLQSLEQKVSIIEKEFTGLTAKTSGKKELLKIVREEQKEIENLLKIGAVGKSEKYRLDREQKSLMNELSAIEEAKKIKEVETVGVRKEIDALIVLYEEEIINEIANLQPKILELQTKIPAFMERLSDTKIISPINGKINKVFFNTVGAIVRDGEKLVEIVPTDESLEVKGYVDPKDIGLIEPGQSARLSLTAFDPSKYGFLSGELKKVSADAIFREETRSYMFEITTTIDRSSLPISNGETIPIYPGMIAQIDIIRGSRSILDYLWQPVSKTRDFAFRE